MEGEYNLALSWRNWLIWNIVAMIGAIVIACTWYLHHKINYLIQRHFHSQLTEKLINFAFYLSIVYPSLCSLILGITGLVFCKNREGKLCADSELKSTGKFILIWSIVDLVFSILFACFVCCAYVFIELYKQAMAD